MALWHYVLIQTFHGSGSNTIQAHRPGQKLAMFQGNILRSNFLTDFGCYNRVAKLVRHVVRNNAMIYCVEMFWAFGLALTVWSVERAVSEPTFELEKSLAVELFHTVG